MDRKWFVAVGLVGLSCGALAVQSCSSSGSSGGGDDGGGELGLRLDGLGVELGFLELQLQFQLELLGRIHVIELGGGVDSGHDGGDAGDATIGSDAGDAGDAGDSSSTGDAADTGVDAPPDSGGPDATCTPFDAGTLDPNLADAGMNLVLQFKCYGCHQSNALDAGGLILSGKSTSLSDAAPIFPPNLTPDPATGLGCWTTDQISNAMLNGVDNQGVSLCTMPKFGPRFTDAGLDIDASTGQIIEFLRSLSAVSNQVPDTVCPSPPSDAGEAGDAPGGD